MINGIRAVQTHRNQGITKFPLQFPVGEPCKDVSALYLLGMGLWVGRGGMGRTHVTLYPFEDATLRNKHHEIHFIQNLILSTEQPTRDYSCV
jgi:hypothetical protein